MLPLDLSRSLGPRPRILCLGAHPDDIEIGCGGTILQLSKLLVDCHWDWVILTGSEARHTEARESASRFLGKDASLELRLESFRDGYLPYEGAQVKDFFESIKREIQPNLILTHFAMDKHQDHRLISDLTWNTWRDHLILEYEIPKFDGDLGQPQTYFDFDRATAERKAKTILEAFASQKSKEWFDSEVLMALMRLRGVECNAPGRYAEAFYARKWRLSAGNGA
jgi:LmbE family N-acetylglucosaminyl deacetylase